MSNQQGRSKFSLPNERPRAHATKTSFNPSRQSRIYATRGILRETNKTTATKNRRTHIPKATYVCTDRRDPPPQTTTQHHKQVNKIGHASHDCDVKHQTLQIKYEGGGRTPYGLSAGEDTSQSALPLRNEHNKCNCYVAASCSLSLVRVPARFFVHPSLTIPPSRGSTRN